MNTRISKLWICAITLSAVFSASIAKNITDFGAKIVRDSLEFVQPTWKWDTEHKEVTFPDGFLWGAATCEYQNSGEDGVTGKDTQFETQFPNNSTNWTRWEYAKTKKGTPRVKDGQMSGSSADHWNRYKEDIKLMKELGLTSYRFSLSWNRIEPEQGVFCTESIAHYVDLCNELIANGIEPMVTLHHFTHPTWFEEKGAFEKEENIKYFTRFCKMVFPHLQDKVQLWCTINEPTCYVLTGYLIGIYPPGKNNPHLAGTVLKNLLMAHCQVYDELKKLPGGNQAHIGLVHSMLKFKAYHSWNILEQIPSKYLTHVANNACVNFFKTGQYRFYTPWGTSVKHQDPTAPLKLDYIGLNYYSVVRLSTQWSLSDFMIPTCYPDEVMTDMPYPMYPQGFYDAIKEISVFNVPIYITENGIADGKDDRRGKFIIDYTSAMSRAIKDGYDVRGYYYWTLTDNFEWDSGFDLTKFGLYAVDLETKIRTLRPGAKLYQELVHRFNGSGGPQQATAAA